MKITKPIFTALAVGLLFAACSSNTGSSEEMPPASETGEIEPEWTITQRSPRENGNAEAWGLDIHSGKIFWAVSQIMPGSQMDIFLHRYDSDGNLNWSETVFSGQYTDQAYFLTATDSLAYIGGRTCTQPIGIKGCNALVATADAATGTPQWNTSWDHSGGYEEVDGIIPQPDGLLVSGWSMGDETAMDLFLQKTNHSGDVLWTQTWSSPGERDDHQDGHIVADESMVYMAGLYDGSPGLGWNGKALLMKLEKNSGALVDSVTFGRQDNWVNAENALGMSTDGQYLYITGYTTPAANNWDIFVTKYDKNHNRIWYTMWGGDGTESARSLVIDSAGQIYVAGTTQSYGNGGSDVVLIELNSSGEVQWHRTWGGSGDESAFDIRLYDGSVYITGRTNSFHPNGTNEAFLIREGLD